MTNGIENNWVFPVSLILAGITPGLSAEKNKQNKINKTFHINDERQFIDFQPQHLVTFYLVWLINDWFKEIQTSQSIFLNCTAEW